VSEGRRSGAKTSEQRPQDWGWLLWGLKRLVF